MLYVEGKIRSRSYDDQNGVKRYVTEVVADNIELLSRKAGGVEVENGGGKHDYSNAAEIPGEPNEISEVDDLPF